MGKILIMRYAIDDELEADPFRPQEGNFAQ
jgi:hypothetical protein